MLKLTKHFLSQGIVYMEWPEKIVKLSFSLCFSFVFYLFVGNIIVAFVLGHTANFLLTGQHEVLRRYISRSEVDLTTAKVFRCVNGLFIFTRLECVSEVLIYGSLCRGAVKKTSDLDVRVKVSNSYCAFLVSFLVQCFRAYSNWFKIPLDIYVFYQPMFLEKLRDDELPLALSDYKDGREFVKRNQLRLSNLS